jgi:hypothetical protein
MAPKGPFRLCTVNKAPERAKLLVGRVVADVKAEYTIDYLENVTRMSSLHHSLFLLARRILSAGRGCLVCGFMC